MIIDKHISDLLFSHDCVIVPGLGGFIANPEPAHIHPSRHTLYPPYKKIAFNRSLQKNDGLLANYVSTQEKITYTEALKEITSFVENRKKLLDNGKRVIVEGIGTLYQDKNRNLLFEPDNSVNYFTDAFGLTPLQFRPIRRETAEQKLTQKIKERKPAKVRELRPSDAGPKKNVWYAVAAAVIPLFVFSLIITLNPSLLDKAGFNKADINPIADTSVKTEENAVPQETVPPHADEKTEETPASSPEPAPASEQEITAPVTPDVVLAPQPVPAAPAPVAAEQPDGSYFIIGGCFRNPANAERLVADLRSKGFPAAIIGRTRRGLQIVSFKGYSTHDSAASELPVIQSQHIRDAWIYQQ